MSKKFFAMASLAVLPTLAQAGVYRIAFDATKFKPVDSLTGEVYGPSPVGVINGAATVDFGENDLGAPILLDMQTTVDGVSHVFPDLGALRSSLDASWEALMIGAGPSGLQSIASATDDFFFSAVKLQGASPLNLIWGRVTYSLPGTAGIWNADPVAMSVTAVPEVGTLGLSLMGVCAIALAARRKSAALKHPRHA